MCSRYSPCSIFAVSTLGRMREKERKKLLQSHQVCFVLFCVCVCVCVCVHCHDLFLLAVSGPSLSLQALRERARRTKRTKEGRKLTSLNLVLCLNPGLTSHWLCWVLPSLPWEKRSEPKWPFGPSTIWSATLTPI